MSNGIYRYEYDGNIQLLEKVDEEDGCTGCYFHEPEEDYCAANLYRYNCQPDKIFRPYVEPVITLNRSSDYQVEEDGVSLERVKVAGGTATDALKIQIGGSHYKEMPIQPVEFCQRNRIPYCEANAIKYLCRHRDKGGAEDLRKAIHYIQLLLEMEYDEDYGV